MHRNEVDRNLLSPMMIQYMDIKDKYEDCIIFFRLGDFYEMFFEDAILVSHLLELTLTGKNAGLEERVPMCGIPYKAYSSYAFALIDKGYKVAIVEQLEDPKTTKDMVKRDVVQIITKGTRLDSDINSNDNNYISSICNMEHCYIVSFCDVSTGDIYSSILEKDNDEIIKYALKNHFIESIVSTNIDRLLISQLREAGILVTIYDNYDVDDSYKYIYRNLDDDRMINGIKHLLCYILENKKGDLHHLKVATKIYSKDYLKFDSNAIINLELTRTLRSDSRENSLLWLLDKCKTAMGSRYLKTNIENPYTDLKKINRRLDIVSCLSCEFLIRDDLKKYLDEVYDLERLASRIVYGNMNAKDMLQLKSSIKYFSNINDILEKIKYNNKLVVMDDLYSLLDKSILEDPALTLHEGVLIKEGYSKELDELKSISSGSKDFIIQLENDERQRTGIKNLKVGYNKVFGYYIEVSKGQLGLVKDEFNYIRKQTLSNCERFITPLLKEKENIILGAEEKIINLEYKLFMDIREIVKRYVKDLQNNAKIISEVDMLQSFSYVSDSNNYVRPNFNKDGNVKIIGARHPTIELKLKEKYVPNDIIMDKNCSTLLITGPNMAGKSTYMRLYALIVIMAQIGCFVPATTCDIPIFDKIFTRIGASDDLIGGKSTFMVEMQEAENAISEATKNSLILFDELGRGTATYDGMALAQSILEYIHNNIGAKLVFSTHYHELTSLDKDLKHLKNIHVSAKEEEGNVVFLHKVLNGPSDKSYGVNVAKLAKLPDSLIERANEILNMYENKKIISTQISLFDQLTIEEENETEEKNWKDDIIDELEELSPLEMTPMDAINYLYELKNKLKIKNN